jgi:peptidoglycan/LPS O-acetylase OafA/YrhL
MKSSLPSSSSRLASLDGFRTFGIFVVMTFHYTTRWAVPYHSVTVYPYGTVLSSWFLHLMTASFVHVFFILSGFLIYGNLSRSSSLGQFLFKRWARLAPTFLLCTSLTYCFLKSLGTLNPFPVTLWDFIPSLLFINPYILNKIMPVSVQWMDGAYWYLEVEVFFSIIAGILYFLTGKQFFRAFIVVYLISLLCLAMDHFFHVSALGTLSKIFLLNAYLPWFLTGMGFYEWLGRDRPHKKRGLVLLTIGILGIFLNAFLQKDLGLFITACIGIPLFYHLLQEGHCQRLFSYPFLSGFGTRSYSFYLLHQHIGVAGVIALSAALPLIHPLVHLGVMMIILISASLLLFKFWEQPCYKYLTFKKNQDRVNATRKP